MEEKKLSPELEAKLKQICENIKSGKEKLTTVEIKPLKQIQKEWEKEDCE